MKPNISDCFGSHLRDGLHNLTKDSGPDVKYAKGVLVGTVNSVMGMYRASFSDAIKILVPYFPRLSEIDWERVPETWRDDIFRYVNQERNSQ